jgi:paired amphipathic helix protein Sin3a
LARPTFSAEEAEFFQKVKTYIGNKATYNAFLKVLNLFSQQIVDQNILVSRVESFIGGHAELFDWFKQLVGYEEDEDEEDNLKAPRPSNNNNYHPPPSDESVGCGPSYRRIANKAWQDRSCSGRDALCWDVLNDTYISHPTWASEDTGYVAAKKNQYEEALHRVEEERYDYDLNIEANLNAMAVLEPIAKKLSVMSPEEKANFRLSSDQLAASPSMYQRIIKKIYGPIKGLEMIDLLYSNPSQTVPIVLRRLKQKDDEWKRAQREWNKIWREVERKNFWKSLDYQGITFKINDRKNIAAKTLIARQEQGPFVMHDTSVFKDIARLLYFYLVKQPVYNPDDCLAMRLFLQHFCSAFFDVADVEPSNAEDIVMVEDAGADDDTLSIQSDNTTTTTIKANAAANAAAVAAAAARSSRRARRGRNQLNESKDGKLRKDVLTRNLNSKKKSNFSDDEEEEEEEEEDEEDEEEEEDENDATKEDDSTNVSGDDEDEDEEDDEDESDSRRRTRRRRAAAAAAAAAVSRNSKRSSQQRLPKTTKKTATVTPKLGALIDKAEKSVMEIDDENQKTYNFFGDNSFYCFFRLYQILYDRLVKMKSLDAEFRNDPEKSRRAYEEARDLGITPKRFKGIKKSTK